MQRRRLKPVVAALALLGALLPVPPEVRAVVGPSGVDYQIITVCATGAMTVRADATALAGAGDIAFNVTANGVTELLTVARGGRTNHTVIGVNAMPAGVSVSEGATVVASALYGSKCPPISNDTFKNTSHFVPMAPFRILDTRPDSRVNYTGDKPTAGHTTGLVLGGVRGIPANATAVVLNITATEPEAPGFVQAYPFLLAKPGSTSNVNIERAGQTIPNAAIVRLGIAGAIGLFTSTTTHLVVDVAGYFEPASYIAAVNVFVSTSGRFKGVAPTRIFDTRAATAVQYVGAKPVGGQTMEFAAVPNINAPEFPLPAGMPPLATIGSAVLNITATESSGPGFVQVAAGGALVPGASSNLNLNTPDQTIANLVIVPVSADGKISIYTSGKTHLIADLIGYFTNSTAGASPNGLFEPVSPERVFDSRPGSRVDGGTFDGSPGTRAKIAFKGLSTNVGTVILNVTATENATPGYIQVGATVVPGAYSNLNLDHANQTIPNLVISGTTDLSLTPRSDLEIFTSGQTQIVADVFGWFVYAPV